MHNKINLRRLLMLMAFILMGLSLSSCAAAGYSSANSGLFSGFFHGMALPFALISKAFGMAYGLYAKHNNGLAYWTGYVLGFATLAYLIKTLPAWPSKNKE